MDASLHMFLFTCNQLSFADISGNDVGSTHKNVDTQQPDNVKNSLLPYVICIILKGVCHGSLINSSPPSAAYMRQRTGQYCSR